MQKKFKRYWTLMLEEFALLSTELIVVLVLGFICLGIFLKMAQQLKLNNLNGFDERVHQFINSYTSESVDVFMKTITWLGNPQFAIFPTLIVFIYFLMIKPHRWYSIKIPVISLGSWIMNQLLKNHFERPRPIKIESISKIVSSFSFPSGHAMFIAAFYGLLLVIAAERIQHKLLRHVVMTTLLLIIILVGASRVYLNVHYASDVIAGFAAGILWLLLCLGGINLVETYIAKRGKPQHLHSLKS